jgi:hypothetical protein
VLLSCYPPKTNKQIFTSLNYDLSGPIQDAS